MFKNKTFFALLTVIVFLLSALGCKDKVRPAENNQLDTTHTTMETPINGLFEAKLPCADCSGILTRIFLRKDFTYIKEENYNGVTDTMPHIFYDLGTWSVKDSIVTLLGQTSDTFQYKIAADKNIQMLTQDGNALPDSIASQYVFKNIGKTFQSIKPFLVSGVLDRSNDQNTLHICVWNKTVEVSFNSTSNAQLVSLWEKRKDPQAKKGIIQAEGSFDPKNENKLLVEKVNNIIDGDNCN